MNEETFKNLFMVVFLGSWTAKNYDVSVAAGQKGILNDPPVQDAEYLAGVAWDKFFYAQRKEPVFN